MWAQQQSIAAAVIDSFPYANVRYANHVPSPAAATTAAAAAGFTVPYVADINLLIGAVHQPADVIMNDSIHLQCNSHSSGA